VGAAVLEGLRLLDEGELDRAQAAAHIADTVATFVGENILAPLRLERKLGRP
jgi:hypothetical protein